MPSIGTEKAQNGDGCESDVSFTWEDFFGKSAFYGCSWFPFSE